MAASPALQADIKESKSTNRSFEIGYGDIEEEIKNADWNYKATQKINLKDNSLKESPA